MFNQQPIDHIYLAWAHTHLSVSVLSMLFEPKPAQVMANNCIHFDVLAKYCSMNSKKPAAVLSVVIKKSENRFQYC